jgi:membrane protein DedA with SNARE-associated domain
MSWIGRALLPFFDEVPLLVVFLDSQPYLIILAAERTPFWPLLILATVRMLMADPVWYHLGRYCSEWILSDTRKKRRKILKKPRKILQALVDHRENKHLKSKKTRWAIQGTAYLLVLLYATGFVMCAAGILELRRRVVAVLCVIGTSAQVYALMALGSELF